MDVRWDRKVVFGDLGARRDRKVVWDESVAMAPQHRGACKRVRTDLLPVQFLQWFVRVCVGGSATLSDLRPGGFRSDDNDDVNNDDADDKDDKDDDDADDDA